MVSKALLKIASWIYRQRGESPESRGAALWAKIAVFVGMLGLLGALYGPVVARTVRDWSTFHLDIPLASEEWRFLDADGSGCGPSPRASARCAASPENPALWTSPERRGDPYRELHTPGARARHYSHQTFWIGYKVPTAALALAVASSANSLVLGWINAPYAIWIDGQLMLEGDGARDTEPITITVPLERLREHRPLYVAARVKVVPGIPILDALNEDRIGRDLGRDGVGFASQAGLAVYRQLVGFWGKARPFGLALGYVLIGSLLFFFWLPVKRKPEYFYAMLFALTSACYQAMRFDVFHFGLREGLNSRLELIFLCWMPSGATFAMLAFARLRRAIFTYGVPLAFGLPVVAAALLPDSALESSKMNVIMYAVPPLRALSVMACLLQIYYLRQKSRIGLSIPVRVRRLAWLVAGDIFALVFYSVVFHDIDQAPKRLYWLGFEHLAFLLFFCAVALSDHSAEERLVQSTPVSEYHQRAALPDKLSGLVLAVDLRDSERLSRAGARLGESGRYVESCLSHLWDAILRAQGIVLRTDGDGLMAFFDSSKLDVPMAGALKAVDNIASSLESLTQRLRAEGVLGPADELAFRAGLARGEIKPVWHQIASTRYASWAEAGASNVFVEAARFMELERQLEHSHGRQAGGFRGLLVVSEALAAEFLDAHRELSPSFVARGIELTGKHDRRYVCAAYVPRLERPKPRLTVVPKVS